MPLDNSSEPSDSDSATLVFPAGHADGLKYLEAARENEQNVVAASSEWDSQLAIEIGELISLPYVYEPEFPNCFLKLVQLRNIAQVYAPVAAVHAWLERFISSNNLRIRLVGESPSQREMNHARKLNGKVVRYRDFIDQCAGGASDLSNIEIASVFNMASHIYGESNENKIAAMMAIFSSAPKGDVVEIGSLAGKSASVLAFLSRRYQVGNVVAIDPWQLESATQHDSPDIVRVHMVGEWEYEILQQRFLLNILPIGLGVLNYLRQESAKGFELFKENLSIVSPEFGRTEYQGKIAVIHIDGNHDYSKVKLDCELWLPLLMMNGWLILDDYVWAHGDGPRRVGDALLEHRASSIERAFVCGKALFVKFAGCGVDY